MIPLRLDAQRPKIFALGLLACDKPDFAVSNGKLFRHGGETPLFLCFADVFLLNSISLSFPFFFFFSLPPFPTISDYFHRGPGVVAPPQPISPFQALLLPHPKIQLPNVSRPLIVCFTIILRKSSLPRSEWDSFYRSSASLLPDMDYISKPHSSLGRLYRPLPEVLFSPSPFL